MASSKNLNLQKPLSAQDSLFMQLLSPDVRFLIYTYVAASDSCFYDVLEPRNNVPYTLTELRKTNSKIREDIASWYRHNTFWLTENHGDIYMSSTPGNSKHYLKCPSVFPLPPQAALNWHHFCFHDTTPVQNLVIDIQCELLEVKKSLDALKTLFEEPYRIDQLQNGYLTHYALQFTNRLRNVELVFQSEGGPGLLCLYEVLKTWALIWYIISRRTVVQLNAIQAHRFSGFFWKKYGRRLRVVVMKRNKVVKSMVVDHSTMMNNLPFWMFPYTLRETWKSTLKEAVSIAFITTCSMVLAHAICKSS